MEQFEIDDITVGMLPLKPRIALRLDKKITILIIKVLGGENKLNILNFQEIKIEDLLSNFATAFDSMTDEEFLKLSLDLLSMSQIDRKDKQVIQISSEDTFDKAFEGCKPITIYKVLFKVMEVNKFTPFVLAEETGLLDIVGSLTQTTSSSNEDETLPQKN